MSASPKGSGWRSTHAAPSTDQAAEGADVLSRLAQRDASAMVDLHQTFGSPLFSFSLQILSDRGDAEEALQDAYVRIWNKAGDFDPARGRPFTWCCLIVRGCCIDKLRRRKAIKRGSGKIIPLSPELIAETAASASSDVRAQAIWHEQIEQVRRALETLRPLERRYIEEAIFRGKTHHEISDEGGEPLGTVKSRIRRGMINLRKQLRTKNNLKP
ncbi:MAG: RNA polymerase sigma factor [Verrucomicrobiales bacterium]